MDEKLLKKMKEKYDAGPESASIADIPLLFKFSKALLAENEELREDYIDTEMNVSLILTDFDKQFWIRIKEADFEYGDGPIDDATFTLKASVETMIKILFGVSDATSEYMAGSISVDGDLTAAMEFNEIIELGFEQFEDMIGALQ